MTDQELAEAEELVASGDLEAWRKYMAGALTEEDREWLARGGIV